MKVRVTLTLDVDVEAWHLTYGKSPAEVREDVRDYAVACLAGSAAAEEGCLRVVVQPVAVRR